MMKTVLELRYELLQRLSPVRCQRNHPDDGRYAPVHYHDGETIDETLAKELVAVLTTGEQAGVARAMQ